MKKSLFHRPALYIVLGLYIIVSYHSLAIEGNQIDNFFFTEDHFFENVGAISLFITAGLFFYGFLRARQEPLRDKTHWIKQLAFLGFAVIAFFGGGEEISWGQRIFNIQEPAALEQINAQDELTVHNIEINGQQLNFETPFDMMWFTVVVLIPLAVIAFPFAKKLATTYFPGVFLPIGGLFLTNYLWAKVAKILYVGVYTFNDTIPFVQAVQEVKESHYELLFALTALYAVLDLLSGDS